jgi:hypothetical protein
MIHYFPTRHAPFRYPQATFKEQDEKNPNISILKNSI